MSSKINIAIHLLRNLRWEKVYKCHVAIFDRANHETIVSFGLKEIPYYVIPSRFEALTLNSYILLLWPFLFLSVAIKKYLFGVEIVGSALVAAYFLARIKNVSPKVVLTFIDTPTHFYNFPLLYKDATYIAFQNGTRWHLIDHPTKARIPHYFGLGYFDRDIFKQWGHRIGQFYPIGSLKGGYAEQQFGDQEHEFEICLVSVWRESIMKGNSLPDVKLAIVKMLDYLTRYLNETGATLCIATSQSTPSEIKYYRDLFGTKAVIFENIPKELTTYRAMRRARVLVSTWSTAMVEALGWGQLGVFTNYSGNPRYSFPLRDQFMPKDETYEAFKEKLDEFRTLEKEKKTAILDLGSYFVSYSKQFNNDLVHNVITKVIESRKVWDGSEPIVLPEALKPDPKLHYHFTIEDGLTTRSSN